MGEGKFFVVRSQLNGMVLDIQDSNLAPGNPVALWHYNGGENQLFYEDFVNCCIRSAMDDNFCLEIMGDQLTINLFNPHESMQRWCTCGDVLQNRDLGSVLDVADHCMDEGARVCSWDRNGGPNQSFSFEYQPARYAFIKNEESGKVFDVRGGDASPGTKVVMYEFNGQENQVWYEDRWGCIHSKLNDFVIDTNDGDARLQPYDPTNPGQQWVKSDNRIINKMDHSICIDVKGGKKGNDAKLCAYGYKGAENQHFTFEYL